MAESQVGVKAVVWGLTTSATATGMGTFTTQSATFTAESEKVEVKNNLGQTVTAIFFNQTQLLTLEVVPSADTVANARTANILPAPGAIVTVTDANDTELTGTNSGKYVFIRGTKNKSNTAETRLTFELIQWVENDNAVAIS